MLYRNRNRIATIFSLVGVFLILITPATPAGQTENVLLITFDGLRWQELFGGADERMLSPRAGAVENIPKTRQAFWAETPEERREILLPFFWNTIVEEGQVYGDPSRKSAVTVTNGRYFSYPGYNEILAGFGDDNITSNAKRPNENVTVLEWVNGLEGFEGRVAAFGSWDVFPFIINEERSGVPVNAGWMPLEHADDDALVPVLNELADEIPHVWDGVRYDVFTFHGAAGSIRNDAPRLLYISFGETDDWAHKKRYDLYLESAQRTDAYIERLWNLVQSLPQYAGKTSLVMTTDHGRGDTPDDWMNHGADVPGAEKIWIAVMGPDTSTKGLMKRTENTQSQVAATVAALLGLDYRAFQPAAGEPIESALDR